MLDQSASQKAALWLSGFADALSRGDAEEAAGQFAETCFWRDLVAFSWTPSPPCCTTPCRAPGRAVG